MKNIDQSKKDTFFNPNVVVYKYFLVQRVYLLIGFNAKKYLFLSIKQPFGITVHYSLYDF